MLICPVCQKPLIFLERSAKCEAGHCFDMAKEGYVNLLRSNKNGDRMGDDKESARSRRDFLNKGYYGLLKEHLVSIFQNKQGSVLDICCGEGYYTSGFGHDTLSVYGFDISKEMIRLAAKRGGGQYFVANMASIPVADNAFDYCTHLFAPFIEEEFARVLKPGGRLFTVLPGAKHLFGLKQALYDTPYENDEKLPQTEDLKLVSVTKLVGEILLACPEDIESVFRMTPYYFHTSRADREKLKQYKQLRTPIEFVIAEYEKEGQ